MIFGSEKRFAIDAVITDFTERGDPLGNICLWADGTRIGDFSVTAPLGSAEVYLRRVVSDIGKRRDKEIDTRSREQVISFLKAALYGNMGTTVRECAELERRFRKFVLCPGLGESFDEEFLVLADNGNETRFIWEDRFSGRVRETGLRLSEYREPIHSFLDWLETQREEQEYEEEIPVRLAA